MSTSRRDFLKFAALLSGATGISGFVPESIQRALAIEPTPGSSFVDAEHIVILMQENRSFDHTFGTLQGVRGFNDPRALRQPNGNSVFVQTSQTTGKSYAPWRLDLRDTRITWMGSIPHSRNSQVDAWNDGLYNNWLDAKKSSNQDYQHMPITMGHYTREDLPFYYALADAFTVCDQSYCAVMSSTTPNRSMFWSGTIRDKQSPDSRVYMRNDELFRDRLGWKTFPERLSKADISWRFYQNELSTTSGLTNEEESWLSNYGCNVLECFGAYNVEAVSTAPALLRKNLASAQKQVANIEERLSELSNPSDTDELHIQLELAQAHVATIKTSLANSGDSGYKQLTPKERALHNAAFVTNRNDPNYRSLEALRFTADGREDIINVPKGDILHQFRTDVESGKLPTVSWLAGPQHFSDHPSSPWYGAWWVSEIVDILTKNPEVWKKTIFILTYDENDGYFDHSPSFVAPDPKRPGTGAVSTGIDAALEYSYKPDELAQGVPDHEARSGPIGMGFRIPTIVASPWTRGGWVNSQLFDHTSTLQFLEQFVQAKFNKTVREENISAWRRSVAGDLTSCFRTQTGKEPVLDYVSRDRHIEQIVAARDKDLPTGFKELTSIEIAAVNANSRATAAISHQEPGTRAACALPYELYTHGALSADGKHFELELRAANDIFGRRSAGAPFNVYLRNLTKRPGMQAATYTVKAGDTLRPTIALDQFKDGRFEIEVLAPNGFYRRFAGTAHEPPAVVVETLQQRDGKPTGAFNLHLHNPSSSARTLTIFDNSYGAAAITRPLGPGATETVTILLESSHQWYDLTIMSADGKALAHFAGRIETGHATQTDPLMGRA
ncbi:phospholipase C, phosphocholine-specific [Granulicella sp. 5B5]|uniref:phosphocholine-specific phospholipase C n=1 Tax=Granulicella sp. 5B5 TaxID=1617967 RepID=UPI0015F433C7|nr:phospholipase C, phosphocholine-specific [Granulicella sp. 5B5]QMV17312.1 phospholipase C, phosphocholine-specific [Granulicella sp. 5B5]